MPLYDYVCPKCGYNEEILVFNTRTIIKCSECEEVMEKQFSPEGQKFKLVYNNKTDICDWSGNTSRYWDDVKKQREEEGKLTMPVTEDIS